MEPDVSPSIASVRATKRKLEDAIRTLDGAIESPSLATAAAERPPSKRPHLAHSVFSTLIKFSAMSKEPSRPLSGRDKLDDTVQFPFATSSSAPAGDSVSESTPRLTAILARSTHKRASPSDHILAPVHPASEYRPSSTDSFLSRLATYKIATYANKPPQIDAVTAARCGWINDGKDRVVCPLCDVSWVLAGREGMNKGAANTLVEKQRASLVEMHKDGCPWKARQCDPSVYRVPLHTPAAMIRELQATALSLEPGLANMPIKHPLTLSQLTSLRSILSVVASERWASEHDSITDVDETIPPNPPSDTAIVAALFGWVPSPTVTQSKLRRASFSRVGYGPSVSVPPTPSLSRASSASNHFREPASTSTHFASPPRSISQSNAFPDHTGESPRNSAVPRDTSLVHCLLCQRRVGLWGYSRNEATTLTQDQSSTSVSRQHQKEFDLVKEHRSYCPYIVCSSTVPSFSQSPAAVSSGKAVEGWRAVLTVVQRYELSQQQRLTRYMASDDLDNGASSAELRGVEAMVARVKTNGGRELLRYVKDLLG